MFLNLACLLGSEESFDRDSLVHSFLLEEEVSG